MKTTTRTSFVVLLAFATSVVGAASAQASEPRGPQSVATASDSPYAEPLDALGGLCLAQYLANHVANDRRLLLRPPA